MIKLKSILLEKDGEKPDSENPDKMLVKNKESGKSYYISKDSFDPSVHEKSGDKKKKEEPKEEPKKGGGEKASGGEAGGDPLAAAFGGIDKKEEKKKDEKKKEEEKNLPPHKKMEKKLGSYVSLETKTQEEIVQDIQNTRPDLKKQLAKFEFTPFFREYGNLMQTIKTQNSVGDKENAKETMKSIKKIAQRFQAVALAKLTAVSKPTEDPVVVKAAKYYHSSSTTINRFLRKGNEFGETEILSNDEIQQIRDEMADAIRRRIFINQRYSKEELESMEAINNMDEHFRTEGAVLEYDTVVFRGVFPDVLEQFTEAKEWVDNAFTSTSLNPLVAERFTYEQIDLGGGVVADYGKQEKPAIFKINLKRGMRVLSLPCSEDEFCIESELTLPRGCHFTIVRHDEENNVYEVEVEQPNA
jgi:hypothetical protein